MSVFLLFSPILKNFERNGGMADDLHNEIKMLE
jgi:hypothetical protein